MHALTCAGLDALKPRVIGVSVDSTSAVLKPSAARSATTHSAGFRERAALWAHPRASDYRRDGWRADSHVCYELAFGIRLVSYRLRCS